MSDDNDWEMEADDELCRDIFGENKTLNKIGGLEDLSTDHLDGHYVAVKDDLLTSHAWLTVHTFERLFPLRGFTRGLPKWELELLESAYDALGIPEEDRIVECKDNWHSVKKGFISHKKRWTKKK